MNRWRFLGWGVGALLVLAPAVAMRFTDEVNWGAEDFVFAAVLVLAVGLAYEAVVRITGRRAWRVGAAIVLAIAFLAIWAEAAVGIFD